MRIQSVNVILILLLWLLLVPRADAAVYDEDKSQITTDVGVTSRYIYNVFFDYGRAVTDESLVLTPEIEAHTRQSNLCFSGDFKGLYEQYAAQTIDNHFDFEGTGNIFLNHESPQSFILSGSYKSFSDPSPNETYGRLPRNVIEGKLKGSFKTTKANSLDLTARYNLDAFNNPALSPYGSVIQTNYLTNSTIEGIAQYNSTFLPETAWIGRLSGGSTQYPYSNFGSAIPATSLEPSTTKNNSTYALAEVGLQGRFTEKSNIDFAAGYLYRGYTDQNSFSAPVFYLHFVEQVTRRDQLMAGYDYTVKDSYWTDYYLDQQVYIGLARVVGDQVLILTRLAYDYRSYSLPLTREDERILAAFTVKYSLSDVIKLTADLKLDLLNSDAYNTAPQTSPPTNVNGTTLTFLDAPASYKAGSIGLGLVASF